MHRCNKIYSHPLYKECLKRIEEKEADRIFCLHNLDHALDTARIGYIKILERKLDIDKELYYAAALLHDIGRYSGKPHSESSAEYALKIMPECGFSEKETKTVADAILCHRTKSDGNSFADILSSSDKESRLCFKCKAANECYWQNEKRNKEIDI